MSLHYQNQYCMNSFLFRGWCGLFVLLLSLSSLAQQESLSATDVEQKPDTSNAVPKTVKVAANHKLKGNGLKRSLVGQNYRKEWTTPVEVPVLRITQAYGGLKPTKQGGGKQTKSLRVESKDGREWALRSVEKFPEKAVPEGLRNTAGEKLVEDGISASYPYGILSMPDLSEAANVLYLTDSLVFLPDDPALGEYRETFKNTLMLMELKEPAGFITRQERWKPGKMINTQELLYMMMNSSKIRVDQHAILRARLLDNFIMDFDRHFNQWDWVNIEGPEGKTYYPVPTDRDQAFYRGEGTLVRLASGKTKLPQLQGFRDKAKDVNTFNIAEQGFDRFFLNELNEADWSRQVDEFIASMTDDVIEKAMRRQPKEIQEFAAITIANTLKNKRNFFKQDMMEYYRFLAKTISVSGTNQADRFTVTKSNNGVVTLTVGEIDSAGNISRKLYERVLDPTVTKELRIYGLEGDDKFVLEGAKSGIDIKIIGGPGNDEYANNGDGGKVFVYDVEYERNSFSGDDRLRRRLKGDPLINNYARLGFKYDWATFNIIPEISIGGIFLGPQVKVMNHAFRKEPYSSLHTLSVTRAIDVSSYHLKYHADFIRVFGKTDLVWRADGWLPSSRTFFFGLGNNTNFDKSKGHKYYFAHYNLVNASLLARTRPNSWLNITYGPVFQYFKLKQKPNENRYVSKLYPNHNGQRMEYIGKSFLGGQAGIEIDCRNDHVVTTRGMRLNIYGRAMTNVGRFGNPVAETGGQLDIFTDFIAKKHVVIATSFGGSHIAGDFEFQQAQYLGFRQNLRGYRIGRFAGRSRAYNNSELRIMAPDANLALFRAAAGVYVFNDIARVWADGEESDVWHNGYGWGIFIAPLSRVMLTAAMMYSKEESNLLMVNLGLQF
jgi:hypothetical protein